MSVFVRRAQSAASCNWVARIFKNIHRKQLLHVCSFYHQLMMPLNSNCQRFFSCFFIKINKWPFFLCLLISCWNYFDDFLFVEFKFKLWSIVIIHTNLTRIGTFPTGSLWLYCGKYIVTVTASVIALLFFFLSLTHYFARMSISFFWCRWICWFLFFCGFSNGAYVKSQYLKCWKYSIINSTCSLSNRFIFVITNIMCAVCSETGPI